MAETPVVTAEQLDGFYNEEFIEVQELIFNQHWHMGEAEAIDQLAQRAGLAPGQKVLDAGCGIGEPARYLARKYGCQVVGLNLCERQLRHARRRTQEAGLEGQVDYRLGSFLEMPFENGSFDAVWSQDAFAHAGDKRKVIQECARVLKKGGILAFQDHLRVGETTEKLRQYYAIAVCPYFETLEGYAALLREAGFSVLLLADLTEMYVRDYCERAEKVSKDWREEILRKYGTQAYQEIQGLMEISLDVFARERCAGGGRLVGRKE
ncbi:MAG: methyltransferase domain-containing protein [Candidatus Tectomicrobia bacterium]|uniref:Methyltransferase domain-containing protein n=1 Tax=Tectimicrobiota bacterium TaxID=2528274 RepID=A0A932FWS7_UNCTE|nr:methyltransferase domain-containing protein [Candidatus Tectomicrobia bacterium]